MEDSVDIKKILDRFSAHAEILKQAREDFSGINGHNAIYSLDFAVLYPYIVPRVLQHRQPFDPLARVSNNTFHYLRMNDRIKAFDFGIVVPFATILELLEQFSEQKKYHDTVADSGSLAEAVQNSLITGEISAQILEDELLSRRKLHLPAQDSYKCLVDFVEHLKSGRVQGYGDLFDGMEFKTMLRKSGHLSKMRSALLESRQYKQSDPNDRAFHIDMDALHLLVSRYFNNRGTLYTGPMRTRKVFGKEQKQYARSPHTPLVLLHAVNQTKGRRQAREGAASFFEDAIEFYADAISQLKSVDKFEHIPAHSVQRLAELDRLYRTEIFKDRRKTTNMLTPEELKNAAQSMSSDAVRDAHKRASEKITDSISGLKDILNEDIDEDMMDFVSPEGKNHLEKVFRGLGF